jgi:hypothetical protein
MAFGVPELLHAPEGTTPFTIPETQALRSRPARADSQSAAEATLGLVTVDILGLAGTGVPPEIVNPVELVHWDVATTGQNVSTVSTIVNMTTGVTLQVVGTMGIASDGTGVAVSSVTIQGASIVGSGGVFWWLPNPTLGNVTVAITAVGVCARLILVSGAFRQAAPPTLAATVVSGTTINPALTIAAAPAGSIVIDQGRYMTLGDFITPTAPQTSRYRYDFTGAVFGQLFGSSRALSTAGPVTMTWTKSDEAAAWLLAALVIPGLS